MCDHPGSTKEDYLNEVRVQIDRDGWMVQYVEDQRPYAYTIGLHERALPELLVTGVSPQRAVRMLNRVAQMATRGVPLRPGDQRQLPAGPLIEIVTVEIPDAHLNNAVAFYGPTLQALQLVWADGRGRWPWAATFGDGRGKQPVLGVRGT
jgi:hypothetical protein